jgi:hypothetical protein
MGYDDGIMGVYEIDRSISSFQSVHPSRPFTTPQVVDVASTSRIWVSDFDTDSRVNWYEIIKLYFEVADVVRNWCNRP